MSSLNGTQAFSSRRLPFPQPALPPPAYPTLAPLRRGHHSAQISASSLSSFASSSTSSASSFESEVEAWEDAKSFMGAPSHRRNESWESQTSSDGGALRVGMEGYEEDLEGLGRGAVELLDRLEEESRAYRVRTSCSSDDTSALSTPHDLTPSRRKRTPSTHTLASCHSYTTLRAPEPRNPFLDSSLLPLSFTDTSLSEIDLDGLLLAYELEATSLAAFERSKIATWFPAPPSRRPSTRSFPPLDPVSEIPARRTFSTLPYDELFPHRPAAPFPTITRPKPGFSAARALFPLSSPTFLRTQTDARRRSFSSQGSSSTGSARSHGSFRWSVASGSTAPTIVEEDDRWFPTSKRDSRMSEEESREMRSAELQRRAGKGEELESAKVLLRVGGGGQGEGVESQEVGWENLFETYVVADVFPRPGTSEGWKEERRPSVVERREEERKKEARRQPSKLRKALSSRSFGFGQVKHEVVPPVPRDLRSVRSTASLGRSEAMRSLRGR